MAKDENKLEPIGTYQGVPVYANTEVPKDEIWFVMKNPEEPWEEQEICKWKSLRD